MRESANATIQTTGRDGESERFHADARDEVTALRLGLERAQRERDAALHEVAALVHENRRLRLAVGELHSAHAELEVRAQQLEGLKDALREEAERDWLTGLHNRRYLAREIERLDGITPTGPFSVAVLDLDHFKAINDDHGHDVGDRVLQRVARILTEVLRTSDRVVRSGGEEFVLLMPGTDERAARIGCERARMAISGDDWGQIAPGLNLTGSIGVASTRATTALGPLVTLADRRLYDAKRAGRDRVVDGADRPDPPDVETYVRRLDAV